MASNVLKTLVLFLAFALLSAVPSFSQANGIQVRIVSVRAVQTTFGIGGDEIFLRFSTGGRFPAGNNNAQSIDTGEVWSPNALVNSLGTLTVELLEWDSFNAADLIGAINIDPNQGTGRFTRSLNGDGAQYDVVYDVSFAGNAQQNQSTQTSNAQRSWAAFGVNENITVADCRNDCEEDIGILLQCQGAGLPALVDVPWVSTEKGPAGRTGLLTFNVDGQAFSYNARLGNSGLVGHVPSFTLNPNDPLVEALQAGQVLRVDFEGTAVAIGLRGSRSALEVFKAHCGWNVLPRNNVTQIQTPRPQQPSLVSEPDPFWFASQYNDFDTGQPSSSLTFGIPETDATGFNATCVAGSGTIGVDMIVGFGTLGNGARVNTYVQASGQTFQFDGSVFVSSSEWAGVRANIPANDPVWQALASAQSAVSYGMIGGGGNNSSAQGLGQALRQFLPACQRVAVQRPVLQPQVPQNQQAPAAEVVNYACSDGSQMWVTFIRSGGGAMASVARPGNAPHAMQEVPTGSGARYSDGVAELATNGKGALFSSPTENLVCQVQ